jgi:hypothetical protein
LINNSTHIVGVAQTMEAKTVFNKFIKISVVVLGIMLFSANTVFAEPFISALSGIVSNGGSLTIQGTEFGSKSPAAPLFWDNFEEGASGQLLSTEQKWTTQEECTAANNGGIPSMIFSSEMSNSGSKSAKQVLVRNKPCWTRTRLGLIGDQSNIFFSYKYFAQAGGSGDHTKMGRVGNNDDVHNTPNSGYTAFGPNYWYTFADRYSETALAYVRVVQGQWVRDDTYQTLSSDNTSNGTVQVWRNGVQQFSSNSMITKSSASSADYYNQVFMPYYNEGGTRTVFVDDVYIDNTLSRVEICPGSTWSNRGSCEIQIPSSWSSTSITAVVNQGAIPSGETRYLYVVDSTGAANTQGSQITIGESSGSYISTPTNLRVVDN